MQFKISALAIAAFLLSAGCATKLAPPPDSQTIQQRKPTDAATVYVYRPHVDFAHRVGVYVSANGKRIVNLKDASFTITYWKPGLYHIAGEADVTASTWKLPEGDIEISGTGTYYIELERNIEMETHNEMMFINGMVIPVFTPVSSVVSSDEHWVVKEESAAKAQIAKLGYVEPISKDAP